MLASPAWRGQAGGVTTIALAAPEPQRPALYRLSVEEYDRMVELGILTPEMRIELLDGLLVHRMPSDPPHASTVGRLTRFFIRQEDGRWLTRCQLPLRLPPQRSEPEPDVALLRPRPDFYERAHPGPPDVFLVVEVADSSLEHDQGDKLSLYARAGIPEYWIVNLPGQVLTIYRQPDAATGRYAFVHQVHRGDTLALGAFPDVVLAVADVLPAAVTTVVSPPSQP